MTGSRCFTSVIGTKRQGSPPWIPISPALTRRTNLNRLRFDAARPPPHSAGMAGRQNTSHNLLVVAIFCAIIGLIAYAAWLAPLAGQSGAIAK